MEPNTEPIVERKTDAEIDEIFLKPNPEKPSLDDIGTQIVITRSCHAQKPKGREEKGRVVTCKLYWRFCLTIVAADDHQLLQ
jgi:hypothetical protein